MHDRKCGVSRRAAFGSVLAAFSTAVVTHSDSVSAAAEGLAKAMQAQHGGHWKATVDHSAGFILIKPLPDRARL